MPREGFLTASTFAAAIGISPYTSRAEQWRLITGRKTFDGNAATQHGEDCEDSAVAAYEAHTGEIVRERQQWYELGNLGAHIDGRTQEAVTEFKCPVSGIYEAVPSHYMPQIQGQLAMVAWEHCHFVAWTHEEMRIWRVPFSLEYWNWMKPLLDEFWDCVQNDIEPARLKRKPTPVEVKTERIA